ncbi:MAG: molybdopterin-synthase adenylyltransferase MoeB [Verrucomicrobia bacterium]|nr:molybdopterin-synthase adenylyltransferase MoeB [Verrucomicrobiota bacterium]
MSADLPSLSPAELARYSRHIQLGELGVDGQRRLAAARVLIVGAGGLGSPAALYLAAAGIGTIGVADFDRVATHNLQRQLLHTDATVGQPKVDSAAARLRATNPHINVVTHPEGVTADNALALFADYDVILDGTDNFAARYLNNDAAFFAKRPLVFGSIFKFEGQVAVFDSASGGPCYRCLFPAPPAAGSVPGCGEAGVLGALCGVIGSLQALEVLKLITGLGSPLTGRLLTYDALAPQVQTLSLPRDPHCPLCGSSPTIRTLPTCTAACATPPSMSTEAHPLEVTVTEARQLLDTAADRTLLVDVREPFEIEICQIKDAELIPLRQIPEHVGALPKDKHLLMLCHHGRRSLNATEFLRANGYTAVSSIAGGIDAWAEQIEPTMVRY